MHVHTCTQAGSVIFVGLFFKRRGIERETKIHPPNRKSPRNKNQKRGGSPVLKSGRQEESRTEARSGRRERVLPVIKPWAPFDGGFCSAAWAVRSHRGCGRSSPGSAWRWAACRPRSAARRWAPTRPTSAALGRAGASARRCRSTPGPGAVLTSCATRTTESGGHGSSSTGPAGAQVRKAGRRAHAPSWVGQARWEKSPFQGRDGTLEMLRLGFEKQTRLVHRRQGIE